LKTAGCEIEDEKGFSAIASFARTAGCGIEGERRFSKLVERDFEDKVFLI